MADLRLTVLALAALALGACAQGRDDVHISVGVEAQGAVKAKDYAALYAPYAMMATVAYTNREDLDTKFCPSLTKLGGGYSGPDEDYRIYRKTLRTWTAKLHGLGWQCTSGFIGGVGKCPTGYPKNCQPVPGLEYHVWRRPGAKGPCTDVAIAFRGTDRRDRGDWISNFRWLYRLSPRFDQYAQVQDRIQAVVGDIKTSCGSGIQIVSAGHSLGGGLAQQAAYAAGEGGIRYTYAFDPSPVTGFFDISAVTREKAIKGLGVDRAYEAGEILVLPRIIIENIFPPLGCGPRIRTVRFNLLGGNPIGQHSIADLTEQLAVAGKQGNPKRVEAYAAAQGCTPAPLLIPPPA